MGKQFGRLKPRDEKDIFTRVEWWIFRLTGIVLLLLLAYKLVRTELSSLF